MKLHIRKDKTIKVWSISFPPAIACPDGVPCAQDCYVLKKKTLPKTWSSNFEFYRKSPESYFDEIQKQLTATENQPRFFRWHLAGDIQNTQYFMKMIDLAEKFNAIKFLVFTKNYSAVNKISAETSIPDNLTVFFSAWPGFPVDNPLHFPVTYVQDGSERRVSSEDIECGGVCENCGICWDGKRLGRNFVFSKI